MSDHPPLLNWLMVNGNKVNTWLYRRSKGRIMGHVGHLDVALLTVAGRTSGEPRTNAVGLFEDGGPGWIVTGSAGGSPAEPQWFRNLRAASTASLQIRDRVVPVSVHVLSDAERAAAYPRLVAVAGNFGTYEKKAQGRVIPMARLTPRL